ncbi:MULTISPECIES: glutathione peroxidase [Flavobacterium]|nr:MULTISPECIES: glutathione peroxidase [Flavobacterium]OXA84008.1 glutathione peroxidase [Flavobacterium columnare] [Flavobacterium columnare NBRC 100251 = ATCC 23463]AMA50603.1 glutathione peroxidase [Flavobacterium covae]AND65608.1 glutathione peroxidase [Flavobacterium covae]MCJ1806878.1 glutathione peroxidase [Flavobacterium covae]MCJ1809205.1 glutathione peroxidase [Flavobacterium covae]
MLFCAITWAQKSKSNTEIENTIYQFKVKDINGEMFDFAKLKGKKIMIVNTASECGLTPQYVQLEELYKTFKEHNFVIVGFPANNFGAQEPGSNEQIATFCKKNYGVSFPMMEKISVKGSDIHTLYSFLTEKKKNGVLDSEVKWNFQKYLIDEKGKLVKVVAPQTLPNAEEVINWVKS